jgi:hypothetical protein
VSDSVNKINVRNIVNPFKLLDAVVPHEYDFVIQDPSSAPTDRSRTVPQFGFIAQEVARTDMGRASAKLDNGAFAVEYNQFIPVLVEAVKQQQATIGGLKTTIDQQATQIRALNDWAIIVSQRLGIAPPAGVAIPLTAAGAGGRSAGTVNAASEAGETAEFPGTKLLQNYPNPTNGYTEIFYECNDAGSVAISVTDLQGRVRKTFSNLPKGMNKVVINRGDLEAGSYIYSIVVNGKVAASKQLVIVR